MSPYGGVHTTDNDNAQDRWDIHPFYNIKISINLKSFDGLHKNGEFSWYANDPNADDHMELNILTKIYSYKDNALDMSTPDNIYLPAFDDQPKKSDDKIDISTDKIILDINDDVRKGNLIQDRRIEIKMMCWDDDIIGSNGASGTYDKGIDDILDIDSTQKNQRSDLREINDEYQIIHLYIDPYRWKFINDNNWKTELHQIPSISISGENIISMDGTHDEEISDFYTSLDAGISISLEVK
jgi:hypothetical protein